MRKGVDEVEGAPWACMSNAETSRRMVSMSGEGSPHPTLVARVRMGRITRREKRQASERIEPRRGLILVQ
eukprot:6241572-Prorocentrum_lima.AAC.1